MSRESADVHFVQDRFGKWSTRGRVALPIIDAGIDHYALQCRRGVVSLALGRITAARRRSRDAFAVWVQQHFVTVETHALVGIMRSIGAERVDLSWPDPGDKSMPVVIGPLNVRVQLDYA